MAKQKQISKNDVTGDRGIAFIHRVVSDMAHIWTPKGLELASMGSLSFVMTPPLGLVQEFCKYKAKQAKATFVLNPQANSLTIATSRTLIIGCRPIHQFC